MRRKTVSGIMLTLLLIGMLTLVSNIQPVEASGTIYIASDYTFTHNIYEPIVVLADNIVIDGNGYTLQGTGAWASKGISLSERSNVTIKNMEIKSFHFGIWLNASSNNKIHGNNITANNWRAIMLAGFSDNNSISGNNITNNSTGIGLGFSSYNTISGNNITANNKFGIEVLDSLQNTISGNNVTNNGYGIGLAKSSNHTISGNNVTNKEYGVWLFFSSNNKFYHNNFINNTTQAYIQGGELNTWDDGYPSGGNYWSNYTGVDVKSDPNQDQPGSDGIGDTPYQIPIFDIYFQIFGFCYDSYPLTYPWGAPSPPSYTLTIYSSPSGVTFTVDDVSRTTPWSGTYSEGTSVSLVMPETHDGHAWSHWLEDGHEAFYGTYECIGNPCFEEPCLPGMVAALKESSSGRYYILTVDGNFVWGCERSWNGYTPIRGAPIAVTGTASFRQSPYDSWWELEVETLTPRTNRIKTVTMDTDITLTAVYTPPPPPPPVGGKATPINMPISKPEPPTLWVWLATIILPLAATTIFVKLKKKKQ